MIQRRGRQTNIMSAKVTTGVGTSLDVAAYQHIGIAIIGASTADFTVKCAGSYLMAADASLAFGSASSVTNIWDFVGMYDMEDGAFIDGDTGVVFSGNDVRQFMVNTDGLRTLNFNITARVGGACTVVAFPIQAG